MFICLFCRKCAQNTRLNTVPPWAKYQSMLKIGQKEEGETRPIKTLHDAVPYCTPNVTCQVKFQFNIHI